MKSLLKRVVGGLTVLMMLFAPVAASGMATAACNPETLKDENGDACTIVETSVLPGDMSIEDILKLVLNILVYGLGAAAVLGVIIAGIMYMTARDNEAQVAKAKTRLFEVVIGLIAWAVMFAVLNWLVPGGVSL